MPYETLDECRIEIPRTGAMRVPGRVYTSPLLLPHLEA